MRETEALAPENLVGRAHALVLAGGSVFGLAAADGVAAALSAQGVGLHAARRLAARFRSFPAPCCTISATAATKAGGMTPPYRDLGVARLARRRRGFRAGIRRRGTRRHGGLDEGRHRFCFVANSATGLIVGALVAAQLRRLGADAGRQDLLGMGVRTRAVNSAAPHRPPPGMDLSDPAPDESRLMALGRLQPGANTTLAVVACNADLTTVGVQASRHDGAGWHRARGAPGTHAVRRRHDIRARRQFVAFGSRPRARRARRAHRFSGGRLSVPRHRARRASRSTGAALDTYGPALRDEGPCVTSARKIEGVRRER